MTLLHICSLALHFADNCILLAVYGLVSKQRLVMNLCSANVLGLLLVCQAAKNFLPLEHPVLPLLNAALMSAALVPLNKARKKGRSILFSVLLYFAFMFFCEAAAYVFASILFPRVREFEDNHIFMLGAVSRLLAAVLLYVFQWALRRFQLFGLLPRGNRRWLLVAPVPLLFCALMLLYSPFAKLSHQVSELFWWCVGALMVAFLYMVALALWIFREKRAKVRISAAEKYLNMAAHHARRLEKEQTKVRHTVHDIQNHLDFLRESSSQRMYLDTLQSHLKTPGRITGNHDIDAVLQYKSAQLPAGVALHCHGSLPASLPWLNPVDVVILLGNALDNAGEAAQRTGGEIEIRFHYDGASCVFSVRNPYCGPAFDNHNLPITTKKEAGHGNGLQSMREAAARYHGMISLSGTGSVCTLRVVLQNMKIQE